MLIPIANISIDNGDFTCADVGTNQVVLSVTDNADNTTTCMANVAVIDNIAPTITCPYTATSVVEVSGCDGIMPNLANDIPGSDACGPVTVSQDIVAGVSLGNAGNSAIVTFTVTDAAGNTNTTNCSVEVTVIDATMPTFQFCQCLLSNSVHQ